jgi:hypothetical protein
MVGDRELLHKDRDVRGQVLGDLEQGGAGNDVHVLCEPAAEVRSRVCVRMDAVGHHLVFARRIVVVMPAVPTFAAVHFYCERDPVAGLQGLAIEIHRAGRVLADIDDGADDLVSADVGED